MSRESYIRGFCKVAALMPLGGASIARAARTLGYRVGRALLHDKKTDEEMINSFAKRVFPRKNRNVQNGVPVPMPAPYVRKQDVTLNYPRNNGVPVPSEQRVTLNNLLRDSRKLHFHGVSGLRHRLAPHPRATEAPLMYSGRHSSPAAEESVTPAEPSQPKLAY